MWLADKSTISILWTIHPLCWSRTLLLLCSNTVNWNRQAIQCLFHSRSTWIRAQLCIFFFQRSKLCASLQQSSIFLKKGFGISCHFVLLQLAEWLVVLSCCLFSYGILKWSVRSGKEDEWVMGLYLYKKSWNCKAVESSTVVEISQLELKSFHWKFDIVHFHRGISAFIK